MSHDFVGLLQEVRAAFTAKVDPASDLAKPSIELTQGERVERLGTEWIYHFCGNERDLPDVDNVNVRVKCKGFVIEGRLLARRAGKIILALSRDIGIQTPRAILNAESKSIFEKAVEALSKVSTEALTAGSPACELLGYPTSKNAEPRVVFADTVSRSHRIALSTGFISDLLGAGERILLVSPLNTDLDAIVSEIHARNADGVKNGEVVRLGRFVDKKLRRVCESDCDVDEVATRRGASGLARAAEVRESNQTIRVSMRRIERVLSLFSEYRETCELAERLSNELRPHECRLDDFRRELGKADRVVERTSADLERSKRMILIRRIAAGLKPAQLLQQLRTVDQFRRRVRGQIELLDRAISQKRTDVEEALRTKDELGDLVAGLSEPDLKSAYEGFECELKSGTRELETLDSDYASMRQSLLTDARVVAGTVSDVLGANSAIGEFDTIVFDGVGALSAGILFILSTLATKKIIATGAFDSKIRRKNRSRSVLGAHWADAPILEANAFLVQNREAPKVHQVVEYRTETRRRRQDRPDKAVA